MQSNSLISSAAHTQISHRTLSRVIELLESVKYNQPTNQCEALFQQNVRIEKRSAVEAFTTEEVLQDTTDVARSSIRTFSVLWGKTTTKKHKTWEGDGRLEVTSTLWRLLSDTGSTLGTTRASNELQLDTGVHLRIGNKEVEIVEELSSIPLPHASLESKPQEKKIKLSSNKRPPTLRRTISGKPLVFPPPNNEHQWSHNARKLSVREVVLDPLLARSLRPHQWEGVVFLYECAMGLRGAHNLGAILADEMGLGKTLQTIALIWTLLKQGPYGTVICKKVLVITPSSLCANWSKEFTKWLGRERIQTYLVDKTHKVADFSNHPLIPVMIISYEQFVRSFSSVQKYQFDLIVCDEGHRLKNAAVKAAQLLAQLPCRRRIILTGTPIQNHLQEYFTLIDLVNPGVLGSSADFRSQYENPIVAAQQPECSDETKTLAKEKSAELNRIIGKFILRRTQEIMENYLPCKTELIVCCELSRMQKEMYEGVITSWFTSEIKNPFQAIATLRKICNHPCLVDEDADRMNPVEVSGKLRALDSILKNLVIANNENIVIVSYSTKFLNVVEKLCGLNNLKYLRLDGSTPVQHRKALVDSFNKVQARVFLASARAGGAGLNLTAASRLVLTDGDWNPSNDLQALARIWRDGQKRDVTVYRFISTGTIEEKVFQRQLSKLSLGDSVEDPDCAAPVRFSASELRDIFTPNFSSASITHDLIQCGCACEGNVRREYDKKDEMATDSACEAVNQLRDWQHFAKPFSSQFLQEVGLQDSSESITFIFKKISNQNMSTVT